MSSQEGNSRFQLHLFGPITDASNQNIDVEVRFEDGRRYSATFFTLRNLMELFAKNKKTGECQRGTYLWASDMIIVESLSKQVIETSIRGLLEDAEFERAFSRVF